MASRGDDRVYRVAGIPLAFNSKATAKTFLDELFASNGAQSTVRSLGPHPQKKVLVAIVGFSQTPSRLASGSIWQLEVTAHVHERNIVAHLDIDTQFLGFTPLNSPPESDDGWNQIDCIIVSGLSSHSFGSWKQRGGHFMWLVDDGDAFPSNVRALLYGYDSTLFGSASFQDIEDIGARLAAQLRGIRPKAGKSSSHDPEQPRPLVFIAHSLGGLVVKEAIYHLAEQDATDAQCIYGLVCFGVPHFGLRVEPWLRIMGQQPNRKLIEDLRSNSRVLRKLDDRFRKGLKFDGLRVVSIFETMTSVTVQVGHPQRCKPPPIRR